MRLGMDQTDAEDLAQEAIARLLRALPDVSCPEAWLEAVVRNLVHEKRRTRARRRRFRLELAREYLQDCLPGPSWRARIEVRHLLGGMPCRSRRVLGLVLSGHTHREIATILRCEIHQVGPRVARALATARRRLKNRSLRTGRRV